MFEAFCEFITENYSHARKIVEVGVGHRIDVAVKLKTRLSNAEVIVTDNDESWVRTHKAPGIKAVLDDVMRPRLALYLGAALVYSLHPPSELVPSLVDLAGKVGADLLLVPVMDEQEVFHAGQWRRLTNRGRTVGWLLPNKRLG